MRVCIYALTHVCPHTFFLNVRHCFQALDAWRGTKEMKFLSLEGLVI